jgi:hypothetical protein
VSFAAEISTFGVKTKEQMDFFVFTICTEITNGIVLKTPVDTGRARANWFPSLDAPSGNVTTKIDPSGSGAIASARPLAEQASGRVFYLTNNLPYIRHLEYGLYGAPPGSANGPKTIGGFSKQAPAGMVRVTINEVVRAYS